MIRKFNQYIKDNGLKKTWVASQLGITNVYLSYLLNEKFIPSNELENKMREFMS